MTRLCGHATLTDEDGENEQANRNVEDRGCHIEEPIGSHGEKPQEKQEKEQAAPVLLHLERETTYLHHEL